MKREIKLILGTAFLVTIIINGISLINRLISALLFKTITQAVHIFSKDILWLITVIGVIIILNSFFKKMKISIKTDIISEKPIVLFSGILILIDGLISLSSQIPVRIQSIQSALTYYKQANHIASNFLAINIASNIIPIVLVLIQITIGVVMIKSNKGIV